MNLSPDTFSTPFNDNFTHRNELGAGLSIWNGETEVVSLTGGHANRDQSQEWTPDTLVPIWSATKGPAALTTLLAMHENGYRTDNKVQDLWPELTAAAKRGLTFGQLLAHKAGLPALDPDNRPSILRHDDVIEALEKQRPFWQAGFGHGYHPRTYGALLDEIVRRLTGGTPLGQFWKQKIATPLGIDIHIGGLGKSELERLAVIYPPKLNSPSEEEKPFYRKLGDPESLPHWAFASPSGMRSPGDINRIEILQAGIPSLGGVASARGLAKFYAILANGGHWKGVQAIPETIISSLTTPVASGEDFTLLLPTAFSTGFMMDPIDEDSGKKVRMLFGPSATSFGQPGAGGSLAFADPENGLSFAYVMNQMESGLMPNAKSLDLVEILYQ